VARWQNGHAVCLYRRASHHGHDLDRIDLLAVILSLRPKDCQASQHRAWGRILVRGSTSRVGLAVRDQKGELFCPPAVEYSESRISRTPCDSHDARNHVRSLCSCTCTSHRILGRSQSSEPFAYMPWRSASRAQAPPRRRFPAVYFLFETAARLSIDMYEPHLRGCCLRSGSGRVESLHAGRRVADDA
jgi:hypothetical protein